MMLNEKNDTVAENVDSQRIGLCMLNELINKTSALKSHAKLVRHLSLGTILHAPWGVCVDRTTSKLEQIRDTMWPADTAASRSQPCGEVHMMTHVILHEDLTDLVCELNVLAQGLVDMHEVMMGRELVTLFNVSFSLLTYEEQMMMQSSSGYHEQISSWDEHVCSHLSNILKFVNDFYDSYIKDARRRIPFS